MAIRASVHSSGPDHRVSVSIDGRESTVPIAARPGGGSAISGYELLCLALATSYCDVLYREAAERGITLAGVDVEVDAEPGGPGKPARRITYRARVGSDASPEAVGALLRHADAIAEVQSTLRAGIAVELVEASPVTPT